MDRRKTKIKKDVIRFLGQIKELNIERVVESIWKLHHNSEPIKETISHFTKPHTQFETKSEIAHKKYKPI